MNRPLCFMTAPCYHSMQLNFFLSVFVLNIDQNFNFFGHQQRKLSCQKKKNNRYKGFGVLGFFEGFRVASLALVLLKFSI